MQRCRAKSKRSGEQCKNYALKNTIVCRMHGARGGPKTTEGFLKCKKAPLQHGFYSQEGKEEMRFMRLLINEENAIEKFVDNKNYFSGTSILSTKINEQNIPTNSN